MDGPLRKVYFFGVSDISCFCRFLFSFITDYTYVDTPYDDVWAPTEDRIVSLLESSSALDGASELAPQKSRRNPLRRAARWARRQFVRGDDDSNQI